MRNICNYQVWMKARWVFWESSNTVPEAANRTDDSKNADPRCKMPGNPYF